jgi:hypothetical protein
VSQTVYCYRCDRPQDRKVMRCLCGCIAFYSGARPLRRLELAKAAPPVVDPRPGTPVFPRGYGSRTLRRRRQSGPDS